MWFLFDFMHWSKIEHCASKDILQGTCLTLERCFTLIQIQKVSMHAEQTEAPYLICFKVLSYSFNDVCLMIVGWFVCMQMHKLPNKWAVASASWDLVWVWLCVCLLIHNYLYVNSDWKCSDTAIFSFHEHTESVPHSLIAARLSHLPHSRLCLIPPFCSLAQLFSLRLWAQLLLVIQQSYNIPGTH